MEQAMYPFGYIKFSNCSTYWNLSVGYSCTQSLCMQTIFSLQNNSGIHVALVHLNQCQTKTEGGQIYTVVVPHRKHTDNFGVFGFYQLLTDNSVNIVNRDIDGGVSRKQNRHLRCWQTFVCFIQKLKMFFGNLKQLSID